MKKALNVGVDLICCQGGEGGGHTGGGSNFHTDTKSGRRCAWP